jgi:hypothetical protein
LQRAGASIGDASTSNSPFSLSNANTMEFSV